MRIPLVALFALTLAACSSARIASGPAGAYDGEGARPGHFGAGLHAGRTAGR